MWWVNPRPWPPYHHHEAKGKNKAYHQKLGRPTVASSGRKEGLCHPDDNLGVPPRPKLPPQCPSDVQLDLYKRGDTRLLFKNMVKKNFF